MNKDSKIDPDNDVFQEALKLATVQKPLSPPPPIMTFHRTLTRRGVVWLGQTCNLHCQFCYFSDRRDAQNHPEHPFMSLEKAKTICKTLVTVYGNNAVDLQGGEPTLFPEIFELISYCKDIGLSPTLITNGLLLDDTDVCRKYKEAGIRDFLVSVHGLKDVHNVLVGRGDAHRRQMRAIRNLQEVGIAFRFNCVLSKPAISQLPYLAELAVNTGARVMNFLTFNPFADQSQKGRRSVVNVPRYSDIRASLTEALDILEQAGIEANVRYFPFCMLEDRHRKSAYNFQQLPYDHHEWDYASWAWTGLQPQRTRDGDVSNTFGLAGYDTLLSLKGPVKKMANIPVLSDLLSQVYKIYCKVKQQGISKHELYRKIARLHADVHCRYSYSVRCSRCSAKGICDGFHGDYAEIFGMEEAVPIGEKNRISDPLFYIRCQSKIVEHDDVSWALPMTVVT